MNRAEKKTKKSGLKKLRWDLENKITQNENFNKSVKVRYVLVDSNAHLLKTKEGVDDLAEIINELQNDLTSLLEEVHRKNCFEQDMEVSYDSSYGGNASMSSELLYAAANPLDKRKKPNTGRDGTASPAHNHDTNNFDILPHCICRSRSRI